MAATRRQFTRAFKVEAVRLATEGGRPVAQVARELGIRPNMLRTWKRQAERRAGFAAVNLFPGNGKATSQDEELRRLQRENEVLRQERDFLQKAAAYVAKESRCSTPASCNSGSSSPSRACAGCLACPAPGCMPPSNDPSASGHTLTSDSA
jgi:transposase